MTNRLMISVAALGAVCRNRFCQCTGYWHEPRGPVGCARAAKRAGRTWRCIRARGNAGGQMNRDAARPGMKSTQTEQKPGAVKNQSAEENTQAPKNKTLSTDNADKAGVKDNTTGQNMKPENRAEDQDLNKANHIDQKMSDETEGKRSHDSKTVGQAGAGAKLSTEQRTKITTVIRDQHVAPVEHVNFSISVGTRVPRDISFHPLPAEVITYYPEWRGYEFILVGDQVVVIDPRSFEIVAVLDA